MTKDISFKKQNFREKVKVTIMLKLKEEHVLLSLVRARYHFTPEDIVARVKAAIAKKKVYI